MDECILISDSDSDFESGISQLRQATRRAEDGGKTQKLSKSLADIVVDLTEKSDDDFEPNDTCYRLSSSLRFPTTLPSQRRMGSPALSSSPSCPKGKGKRAKRHQRTWCVERAERRTLVSAISCSSSSSSSASASASSPVLVISSGEESDSLPDLQSLSAKEDNSMVEGKRERHFMDVLAAGKIKRRDRISSETQAGSGPTPQPENIVVLRYPDLPWSGSSKKRWEKDLKRKSLDCKEKHSVAELESETERKRLHSLRTKFLRGHVPFLVEKMKSSKDFSHLQLSVLEAADDGGDFDPFLFSHFLNILEDFSCTRKPPVSMVKDLVKIGLYDQESVEVAVQTYHLLVYLWSKYPDLVDTDWQMMSTAGEVIKRGFEASALHKMHRAGEPGFVQARLYFTLLVTGFRLNLSQCVLPDRKSVRNSQAAMTLSVDNFQAVKQVIHWLSCSLLASVDHPHSPRGDRNGQPMSGGQEAVHWLWSLQELVDMSIMVSRDQIEAAKRIADEMYRMYLYLPSLSSKKRLLQTVQSPLLCFCVIRLVLENCCEETIPTSASVFPESVRDLAHMYYPALPPKGPMTSMTPPPSPSDEEDGPDSHNCSMDSIEELAMLVYFISRSYISCRQRRLFRDLRQQVLKGLDRDFTKTAELEEMRLSAEAFRNHLQELTFEPLSPAILVYLNLLEALSQAN